MSSCCLECGETILTFSFTPATRYRHTNWEMALGPCLSQVSRSATKVNTQFERRGRDAASGDSRAWARDDAAATTQPGCSWQRHGGCSWRERLVVELAISYDLDDLARGSSGRERLVVEPAREKLEGKVGLVGGNLVEGRRRSAEGSWRVSGRSAEGQRKGQWKAVEGSSSPRVHHVAGALDGREREVVDGVVLDVAGALRLGARVACERRGPLAPLLLDGEPRGRS